MNDLERENIENFKDETKKKPTENYDFLKPFKEILWMKSGLFGRKWFIVGCIII